MTQLSLQDQIVRIDAGELVGYQVNGHEFMHQKGSPGWGSTDTEMFPIIGPTQEADYQVWTPRGTAIQDQHGLLRELTYELKLASQTMAIFQKRYTANTPIKNSKFPKRSSIEKLSWPYDFDFQKQFELTSEGLAITFTIKGEEGMPYMLGYHPAFKTDQNSNVANGHDTLSIAKIKSHGSRACPMKTSEIVDLIGNQRLKIATEGFGHFMLWTEVDTMLCVEPITFYPYEVEQKNLFQGFRYLGKETVRFKVQLQPF